MKRIPDEWRYFDEGLKIPYPWYTGPCLEWLVSLDLKGKRVFEYGVGESTFWYKEKGVTNIWGVDTNEEWARRTLSMHRDNVEGYVDSIKEGFVWGAFDIVVVDGVWRDECTEHALKALKPGGFLIIDNYKQPSVQAEWPLTDRLIEGMDVTYYKEPDHQDWQTIVVIK